MEHETKMETKEGKTAIVAGAGGLTGSLLVDKLIKDADFKKIILLTRKPCKVANPKVQEFVVDFDKLSRTDFWPDADVLFCCIGTTISKAGSRANFRKADYEIPVKLANLCSLFRVPMHLVSSIGADAGSTNFYLRTKGETEDALRAVDLPGLCIYRPSMLYGPRKEIRIGESIGKAIMWVVHPLLAGPLKKYSGIHAGTVASAMIKNAKEGKKGVHIFESEEIKELVRT